MRAPKRPNQNSQETNSSVVTSLKIRLHGRSYHAFKFWGCAALGLAVLLGITVGAHRGLSFWVLIVYAIVALSTFFAVAFVTKVLTGEEGLTFYHQLMGVTTVMAGAAWLLRQPILPAADLTVIAVGATLTFGRIGCLMVGCCHGRPCRFGVRYSAEHAAAGFTPLLVGVRLFPTQVVEFVFAVVLTIIGCLMIRNGSLPGAATAWFIATYCPARFCFEFARWPPNFFFKSGLSQYQWISVALLLFAVSLEFIGVLPFRLWHVLALGAVLFTTAALVLERRLRSTARLLSHPQHVREIATVIDLAVRATSGGRDSEKEFDSMTIPVGCTSLGIRVSADKLIWRTRNVYHYAFSSKSRILTRELVSSMFMKIPNLNHHGRTEVVKGSHGVIHLLIHLDEAL
ncbi:MAG TPA: prolipoprotein diacylglyceryl transferase family protein [Pyrinomonadaceae bacterium]|nr:prolipoprotein diacylglyceryl transferase family protein [Pyrinomonadaceae bacterium]